MGAGGQRYRLGSVPPTEPGPILSSGVTRGAAALTFEAGGADSRHGGAGGLGEALEGRLLIGGLIRGGVFLLLPLIVHPHGLQGQLLPMGTCTRWASGPRDPPGTPIPSPILLEFLFGED